MRPSLENRVSVLGDLNTFGPTKQSFEIRNGSKEEANVLCECLGANGFQVSDQDKKLTVKPHSSARVHVVYQPQTSGCVMTLSAKHRAVITVCLMELGSGACKRLLGVRTVSAVGPGFVSCDEVKCFDPIGAPKQHGETGAR